MKLVNYTYRNVECELRLWTANYCELCLPK